MDCISLSAVKTINLVDEIIILWWNTLRPVIVFWELSLIDLCQLNDRNVSFLKAKQSSNVIPERYVAAFWVEPAYNTAFFKKRLPTLALDSSCTYSGTTAICSLHTQFTAQIYSSLWSDNKIGITIWADWLCSVTTMNNFEEKNNDGGDKIWLIQQNICDLVL
jgi:hypothetical protein